MLIATRATPRIFNNALNRRVTPPFGISFWEVPRSYQTVSSSIFRHKNGMALLTMELFILCGNERPPLRVPLAYVGGARTTIKTPSLCEVTSRYECVRRLCKPATLTYPAPLVSLAQRLGSSVFAGRLTAHLHAMLVSSLSPISGLLTISTDGAITHLSSPLPVRHWCRR